MTWSVTSSRFSQVGRSPSTVEDRHVTETITLVKDVPDQTPEGRETDAPGHEEKIAPGGRIDVEAVPTGASETHFVPGPQRE